MARKAKYTQALPVYVVPGVRELVTTVSDRREVSQAEVVRELIDLGLAHHPDFQGIGRSA